MAKGSTFEQFKDFASRQDKANRLEVASPELVAEAEQRLGFTFPTLLKACYLEFGNGGFGPGYGIIGVGSGHASDFGDVVDTYRELKNCVEYFGGTWITDLLPFSEWGCNIFSCVKCSEPFPVFTFEEGKVWSHDYTLGDFFEMWMNGEDILSRGAKYELNDVTTTNPFTGGQMTVRGKKRIG